MAKKTGLKKKYIKLAGKGGFKKAWKLQKSAERKRGSASKATKKKVVKKKVSRKKVMVKKSVRKTVKRTVRKKAVKKKRVYKKVTNPKKRKGSSVAKKKKSSKKKSYTRRNPGKGIADKIMEGAAVAGGAIGAGLAANQIPVADPRMKAAAVMGVGIFLSTLKPMRPKLAQMVAMGITAAGALSLFRQFAPNLPVMAGENDMYYLPDNDQNAMLGQGPDEDDIDELGQGSYEDDFEDALDGESVDISGDESWITTQDF